MEPNHQVVRYWGLTDADRQAAFQADLPRWRDAGWQVASQITEWPFGKPGLDLTVVYEPAAGGPDAPQRRQGEAARRRPRDAAQRQPRETAQRRPTAGGESLLDGLDQWHGPALRKLMVFGGLLGVVIASAQAGPAGPDGLYPAAARGWLAAATVFEGLVALGLSWYLLRWPRLALPVRVAAAVLLLSFSAFTIPVAVGHLQTVSP